MIDFSRYLMYFEDYCREHDVNFASQEEADSYYQIWIEGYKYALYLYY